MQINEKLIPKTIARKDRKNGTIYRKNNWFK